MAVPREDESTRHKLQVQTINTDIYLIKGQKHG